MKSKNIISLVLPVIMLAALLVSCAVNMIAPTPQGLDVTALGTAASGDRRGADDTTKQSPGSEQTTTPDNTDSPPTAPQDFLIDVDETGLTKVYSKTGRLSPGMPDWTFNLYGQDKTDYWYGMMVLRIFDENWQGFYLDEVSDYIGDLSEAHVILADANFDGYKDVWYTVGSVGAHGHIFYKLLLWNSVKSEFQPTDSFSEIYNPVADVRDKVVRSLAADSAFEEYYGIYRYKDGEYFIDLQLVVTYEDINGKVTTAYIQYQYVNGVRQPLSVFSASESPDPHHPDLEQYYGEDSIWKLADPIWYNSAHFKGIPVDTMPDGGGFSGVLLKGVFYHDDLSEWITYYYVDAGEAQLEALKSYMYAYENNSQVVETEIQLYTVEKNIDLEDYVGQRVNFTGEVFEAHSMYHQRNIIFEVREITREIYGD